MCVLSEFDDPKRDRAAYGSFNRKPDQRWINKFIAKSGDILKYAPYRRTPRCPIPLRLEQ